MQNGRLLRITSFTLHTLSRQKTSVYSAYTTHCIIMIPSRAPAQQTTRQRTYTATQCMRDCNTLQRTATHCNTLQDTATYSV